MTWRGRRRERRLAERVAFAGLALGVALAGAIVWGVFARPG